MFLYPWGISIPRQYARFLEENDLNTPVEQKKTKPSVSVMAKEKSENMGNGKMEIKFTVKSSI